jgi:regulator of cell morphogenesis and NO signaling
MQTIDTQQTVGEIVAHHPCLSQVFEVIGIDYCCGGRKTIEEASLQKGLDPQAVLSMLAEYDRSRTAAAKAASVNPAAMSLTALANHIEATHHAYLRKELARLDAMTEKVAAKHGARDPRLHRVRETFLAMANELYSHMLKEEQVLFPMVRQLDASDEAPQLHCGSLANPIRQMESEHDDAGMGLEQLRQLADGFTPPEWACNTYRAMLDALACLERDMHLHIHKENNVLFPRALEMEARKQPSSMRF